MSKEKIMLDISGINILDYLDDIVSLHIQIKSLTDSIISLSSNSGREKLITLNTKTSKTSIHLIGRSLWNTTSKTLN